MACGRVFIPFLVDAPSQNVPRSTDKSSVVMPVTRITALLQASCQVDIGQQNDQYKAESAYPVHIGSQSCRVCFPFPFFLARHIDFVGYGYQHKPHEIVNYEDIDFTGTF
jgi:hypothetical protein